MINLYNTDCMKFMADKPDNYYDLAIVDPPYGIDVNKMQLGSGKYKTDKKWDNNAPDELFFKELLRVSNNVILWGANHYISKIPIDSSCWLVWDKNNGTSDFADCELAWTNLKKPVRKFVFGLQQQDRVSIKFRFHPTAKPIKLYEWILLDHAKEGDKILDTHGGSGSICIACHNLKFDLDWCELDQDYFEAAKNRFEWHKAQLTLF
jgi:site-specific DNA-methyltransferase (adenine-specific)